MRQSLASSPSLIKKIQRKSGQVFKEEPERFCCFVVVVVNVDDNGLIMRYTFS